MPYFGSGSWNRIFLHVSTNRTFIVERTVCDIALHAASDNSPLLVIAKIKLFQEEDEFHDSHEFTFESVIFDSVEGIREIVETEDLKSVESEIPGTIEILYSHIKRVQRDIAISYMKNFLKIGELVDFSVLNTFIENFSNSEATT